MAQRAAVRSLLEPRVCRRGVCCACIFGYETYLIFGYISFTFKRFSPNTLAWDVRNQVLMDSCGIGVSARRVFFSIFSSLSTQCLDFFSFFFLASFETRSSFASER